MPIAQHHGSCHCKAVTFEAPIDLSGGTVRCNCTFCAKVRNWGIRIADPKALHITKGEADITQYRFEPGRAVYHAFCKHCGIRLYSAGNIPQTGEFTSVSVPALDDLTPAQLEELKIHYANGLDNDWWHAPEHHEYL
ncbi:MAG TPA: GFA family protein [Kofleriaceae bacterium]|jgi:hypothetical protein